MKHYCKLSCGMCKKVTFEDLMKDIDSDADGKVSLTEVRNTRGNRRTAASVCAPSARPCAAAPRTSCPCS